MIHDTGTGDCYSVLGPALGQRDLWLVRHQQTQKLALLQKFSSPGSTVAELLSRRPPQLPSILDSWVEYGAVYVVFERLQGTCLSDLKSHILGLKCRTELRSLNAWFREWGLGPCPAQSVCLTSDGRMQLRYLPHSADRQGGAEPYRYKARPWWTWVQGLFKKTQAA